MRRFELTLWQAGVQIDAVSGTDFAQVHAEAMHLALLYSDDGHVTIEGVPEEKWNEVHAALGILAH